MKKYDKEREAALRLANVDQGQNCEFEIFVRTP